MSDIQTVLLVDDDEDIRTIGQMALAEVGGWTTWLATGGQQAIALAEQHRPDVVLLDVMMPTMDGPTTFRRLREQPSTAKIPVVFMTAKVQRHEVQRYLELGAAGVICKPFDPLTLPDEVRRVVSAARKDGVLEN